jgi:Cys-tRNA(Pro)/Cys-tRNA(Cys) deacylase
MALRFIARKAKNKAPPFAGRNFLLTRGDALGTSMISRKKERIMDVQSIRDQIISALEEGGIPYRNKPHASPVFTSEDAARERGVALKQIVKTMILRDKNGHIVVALLPGDRRLHIKKINRLLGSNFQLMSPEEVQSATGCVVGAISPVGLISQGWEMVADPGIFLNEWVDISSGDPSAGIELRSSDLRKLLNCRIDPISR